MSHVDTVLEEVWRVKDELSNRHQDMADLMTLLKEQREQFEKSAPGIRTRTPSTENNAAAAKEPLADSLLKAVGL